MPLGLPQSVSWQKHLVFLPGNPNIEHRQVCLPLPAPLTHDWSDWYFWVPTTRGVASTHAAAPPENNPKVLNALHLLALDGQEQVSQTATSAVKVQMILEAEMGC